MAKSAYLVLGNDGVVVKCHALLNPNPGPGAPTSNASDLETLISDGYLAKRELALDGGRMLLVLEKP